MNRSALARRHAALIQPRTLFTLATALLAVAVITRQGAALDWRAVWSHLRLASPALLLLALLVFYLTLPVRTLRWRVLLRNAGVADDGQLPPQRVLLAIFFQSWFVNAVTVARLGDVYRSTLLHAASGAARATILGTIVAERLVDVAALAATLGVTALLAFHGHLPRDLGAGSATGMIVAVGGALVLLSAGRWRTLLERVIPTRFHETIAQLSGSVSRSFTNVPLLIGLSVAGWLLEGTTLYLVAVAVSAPISLPGAIAAASIASLLTAVPFVPGGLGLTEVGMVVVLTRLGADVEVAGALTLLYRIVSYWSLVAIGGVFLLARQAAARFRPLARAYS